MEIGIGFSIFGGMVMNRKLFFIVACMSFISCVLSLVSRNMVRALYEGSVGIGFASLFMTKSGKHPEEKE